MPSFFSNRIETVILLGLHDGRDSDLVAALKGDLEVRDPVLRAVVHLLEVGHWAALRLHQRRRCQAVVPVSLKPRTESAQKKISYILETIP